MGAMSTAGTRLQRFLVAAALSQAEFGRRVGVHRSHVGHLLNGRRRATLAQAVLIERLTARWSEGPIRCSEWCALEELAPIQAIEAA